MTGRYAHSNGLMGLINYGWYLPATERTIIDHLNDAGYHTAHVGFQHEREDWQACRYRELIAENRGRHYWYVDYVVDHTIEWLKRHTDDDQPFYVNAGLFETHAPFDRPEYAGRFDPAAITMPGWVSDNPDSRARMALIYGSAEFMDEQLGRLFTALRELGLDENTLVVFNTDHGIDMPRAKATMYDPGIETALIMRWPGIIPAGLKVSHLVSSVDILPSVLELAGLPVAENIQGRSFAPALTGGKYEPRGEVFAEYNFHEIFDPMRVVRTGRFKYIRNLTERSRYYLPDEGPQNNSYLARSCSDKPRPWEELYDLEADPNELNNLAEDPAHAATLTDLRGRVDAWMKQTADPFRGAYEFIYRPANDRRFIPPPTAARGA
jgi:arylsulfatase A-like enzyme